MSSGEHAPLARDIYAALAALPSGPIDLAGIQRMSLDELTREAKGARDAAGAAHAAADLVGTAAVRAGIYTGCVLMQIKARLEHGEWGAWLDEHWGKSPRRAQVYMQLARAHGLARAALLIGQEADEPERTSDQMRRGPSHLEPAGEPPKLSISQALRQLEATREEPEDQEPADEPDDEEDEAPAPRSRGPRPPKEGQALKGDKASCSEAIELIEAVESKVQDWFADHLDPDTFDPDELGKSIADLRKALGTAGMKARSIGRSLGLTQLGSPTTVR